jgi:23S rRNA pseudouridine1911/1915/1917 synthase
MRGVDRTFTISAELAGRTLGAVVREVAGPLSWSQVKELILERRVEVNEVLSVNDARRVAAGERVTVLERPRAQVPREQDVRVVYVDEHVVVVEKPAGVITLRRGEEAEMSDGRKDLQPSLDELVGRLLQPAGPPDKPRRNKPPLPRRRLAAPVLYAVHRLDRDTSGLMMFALTPKARDVLIERFSKHEVRRSYLAVVLGAMTEAARIESEIVRDRGDGLRGSVPEGRKAEDAKRAVTHVEPVERIAGGAYTVVRCRLETGRTHQIRIHLAERGHMLCGEKLYRRPRAGAEEVVDGSGAPRQALHSGSLSFEHPVTGRLLEFSAGWPRDLGGWLEGLRRRG